MWLSQLAPPIVSSFTRTCRLPITIATHMSRIPSSVPGRAKPARAWRFPPLCRLLSSRFLWLWCDQPIQSTAPPCLPPDPSLARPLVDLSSLASLTHFVCASNGRAPSCRSRVRAFVICWKGVGDHVGTAAWICEAITPRVDRTYVVVEFGGGHSHGASHTSG